jgi:hypothetical protein
LPALYLGYYHVHTLLGVWVAKALLNATRFAAQVCSKTDPEVLFGVFTHLNQNKMTYPAQTLNGAMAASTGDPDSRPFFPPMGS